MDFLAGAGRGAMGGRSSLSGRDLRPFAVLAEESTVGRHRLPPLPRACAWWSLDVVRPVDLAAWKENLQMTHIHGEIVIDRPPDAVFDFVADERNEPRYNPRLRRVEQISAGPIGLGTRFRAKTTTMGRTTGMTIVFTGYDRPRRLASSTHLAFMDIHGELRFEPVPGGTRMQWCWEVRPRGVLRLMSSLIARMGRRQEKAVWIGLKRLLEDHRPPASSRSVDSRRSR